MTLPPGIAYKCRHYTPATTRKINAIVIHTAESAETPTSAENVAQWMSGPNAPEASIHVCVDNNSTVRCLEDHNIAWHAGAWEVNQRSLGIELAGSAKQTPAQWADRYSQAVLEQAAQTVAAWCHHYGIPPIHLTSAQVAAGKAGLLGHVDASHAYPVEAAKSGDHWDPGPNFPWAQFISKVVKHMPK